MFSLLFTFKPNNFQNKKQTKNRQNDAISFYYNSKYDQIFEVVAFRNMEYNVVIKFCSEKREH